MFKKLSFFALVALAAASYDNKESRMDCLAPVTVHVNDFLVTVDTFSDTKAPESAADYTGVKAIVLAFYDGETEIYKSDQVKSQTTEQNPKVMKRITFPCFQAYSAVTSSIGL